jgi:hypothetical protein
MELCVELKDVVLDELKAVRSSIAKTEELVACINAVSGCKVHKVRAVRWDSVVIDITLDPRRDES